MRHLLTTAALAALLATPASARGLLDAICDDATERGETATETEYRADPGAHSDDFCALARYEPYKAVRQLSKVVGVNRRFNNPNRFYFDPRAEPGAGYIQLRRDWMDDSWRIFQVPAAGDAPPSVGQHWSGVEAHNCLKRPVLYAVFAAPENGLGFRLKLCVSEFGFDKTVGVRPSYAGAFFQRVHAASARMGRCHPYGLSARSMDMASRYARWRLF